MRRILIIGKSGQIGWELQRSMQPLGAVVAIDYPEIDLSSPDTIRRVIREIAPTVIINAAAYTAVDQAEVESKKALAINATAPGVIAEEAKRLNAYLIHYSTDYVFDGESMEPYLEGDPTRPLGVYGLSKLEGEKAIAAVDHPSLILRTSWVYGTRGSNFLRTMLKLAAERDELQVVADQIGAPTWSKMVAHSTSLLLGQAYHERVDGVYHISSAGQTSWHGFAAAIFELYGVKIRVNPIESKDYPTPAKRPKRSLLNQQKIKSDFSIEMPSWRDSLELCVLDARESYTDQI